MSDEITKYRKAVGQRLREIRKERGNKSYKNFAYENDLEPRQYLRMERGETDFKFSSLIRLLKIHGISPDDFFKSIEQKI